MTYNIDFNICALLIIFIQLFCFYYKKNIPILQNKMYLLLLSFSLFATIADIVNGIASSYPDQSPRWLMNLSSYLFFVFLNLLPVIYAFYCIVLTDTQNTVLKHRSGILFIIPFVLTFLIVAADPFVHWIFYYDVQKVYHRGPGLYILYATAVFYLLYGVIYVTKYRDIIMAGKRTALYSFMFFIAGALIVQQFFPTKLIVMFSVAICTLLVFLTIQNPEEILDGQTGLFNQSAFQTTVAVNFRNKSHFCVISAWIINYDYFKRTFGATIMNDVLRQIARGLNQMPVKHKLLYSLSPGHFVIYLPADELTPGLPEKIKTLMEAGTKRNEMLINLSAHICVIQCPENADSLDDLMMHTDYYEVTPERESVIVYASWKKQSGTARIAAVERAIEDALASDGFEVYYQPIYSTQEKGIHSAEALLRLNDKRLGFIPPDEFIPIAEKNGTIIPIGMLVFRNVCEFISAANLQSRGIHFIEVNLSVAQCMQKMLAEQLLEVLEEYQLPTSCINLEITETAAAYSTENLAANMNKLAGTGIHFSLDDYGTGYSSMSSMLELPFDLVKIDKEIISSLDNERAIIAMNSTISMLKQLRLGIVAEGVETEEQVRFLTEMGCDYLQGYYFSKPVPAEIFLSQYSLLHI